MLELKILTYHGAASLSSQASSTDVWIICWRVIDQLPSDSCTCVQAKKIASQMKPYSSLVTDLKCFVRLWSCYVSLSWPCSLSPRWLKQI